MKVWVDFDAPGQWSGPYCGATVERGPWQLLLNTGQVISP